MWGSTVTETDPSRFHGRFLVVNCLAGRRMPSAPDCIVRRQVVISVVSDQDKDGKSFGKRYSQWADTHDLSGIVLFEEAQHGMRCHFPMAMIDNAPTYVTHLNFIATATLRLEVWVSGVVSAAGNGVLSGFQRGLDNATSALESVVTVPLAQILDGPTAFGSNWVPGKLESEDEGFAAPELFIQVFMLPEHRINLPALQTLLLDERAALDVAFENAKSLKEQQEKQEAMKKDQQATEVKMLAAMTDEQRKLYKSLSPEQQEVMILQFTASLAPPAVQEEAVDPSPLPEGTSESGEEALKEAQRLIDEFKAKEARERLLAAEEAQRQEALRTEAQRQEALRIQAQLQEAQRQTAEAHQEQQRQIMAQHLELKRQAEEAHRAKEARRAEEEAQRSAEAQRVSEMARRVAVEAQNLHQREIQRQAEVAQRKVQEEEERKVQEKAEAERVAKEAEEVARRLRDPPVDLMNMLDDPPCEKSSVDCEEAREASEPACVPEAVAGETTQSSSDVFGALNGLSFDMDPSSCSPQVKADTSVPVPSSGGAAFGGLNDLSFGAVPATVPAAQVSAEASGADRPVLLGSKLGELFAESKPAIGLPLALSAHAWPGGSTSYSGLPRQDRFSELDVLAAQPASTQAWSNPVHRASQQLLSSASAQGFSLQSLEAAALDGLDHSLKF